MKTPTTRAIVDALEYDIRHQYFTAAVTENTREILERHIKPLVDRIAELEKKVVSMADEIDHMSYRP